MDESSSCVEASSSLDSSIHSKDSEPDHFEITNFYTMLIWNGFIRRRYAGSAGQYSSIGQHERTGKLKDLAILITIL